MHCNNHEIHVRRVVLHTYYVLGTVLGNLHCSFLTGHITQADHGLQCLFSPICTPYRFLNQKTPYTGASPTLSGERLPLYDFSAIEGSGENFHPIGLLLGHLISDSSGRTGKSELMVQDADVAWPGLRWTRALWSSEASMQKTYHLLGSPHADRT